MFTKIILPNYKNFKSNCTCLYNNFRPNPISIQNTRLLHTRNNLLQDIRKIKYCNSLRKTHFENKLYSTLLMRNFNKELKVKFHSRQIHSSCILHDSDIPEYFKNIANEISDLYRNEDEDLIKLTFTMEDDIVNYFLSRVISYEEFDTSYMTKCPSCLHEENDHSLFIDKNSGYFVCPGCCIEGHWEEFVKNFAEQERYLTKSLLDDLLLKSKPINENDHQLIESLPFNIDIVKMREMGARVLENRLKIIFPLIGEENCPVGVASISLLLPKVEVVTRILEGHIGLFSCISQNKRSHEKVLIVSNIVDSLKLAKLNIPSIVFVGDPTEKLLVSSFKNIKSVILWYEDCMVPPQIISYLEANNMSAHFVNAAHDQLVSNLPEKTIKKLVSGSLEYVHGSIVTISDLEEAIYQRIINKGTMNGIQWNRYKELNNFLLGHREGELTILSGPTGCGKTTFMTEYSLDLAIQGVRTLWGSFEINIDRLSEIILQQYSGFPLSQVYSQFRLLSAEVSKLPLYFLNIHGQQPVKEVIEMMSRAVKAQRVKHVVIDNLQFMLGLSSTSSDWWLEQDRAVGVFRQFATANKCHVTLIVHPRKLGVGERLNMNSISGGARVTQEADNVFLLQVQENKNGTNNKTLQIVKNRYEGTLGEMKLKFHKESLTLSSCFTTTKKSTKELTSLGDSYDYMHKMRGLPVADHETI